MLETDVDDVTGEVLGYATERLMKMGALDVTLIPSYRKKGRPGYVVRVLARVEDGGRLARTLIEELGTLGVRVSVVPRLIVPKREFLPVNIMVNGKKFNVRVKVSRTLEGHELVIKPEYEDVKKVAEEAGVPLREVVKEVLKRYYS